MRIDRKSVAALITLGSAVIAALLAAVLLTLGGGTTDAFRLYIGAGTTEESLAEGKAKVAEICIQNGTGYTITEGEGGWQSGGEAFAEKSIILTIFGTDKEKATKIAREILPALGQNEIYIEYSAPQLISVTAE